MGVSNKSTSVAPVGLGPRTNTTIPAPANIKDGDLLVIMLYVELAAATPPPGFMPFTGLGGVAFPIHTTTTFWAWRKIASGESGDYLITHGNAPANAFMMVYTGVDLAVIEDVVPSINSGNANPNLLATGVNAATVGSRLIYGGAMWNVPTSGDMVVPTGTTPRFTKLWIPNDSPDSPEGVFGLIVADGQIFSPGATGNKTATNGPTLDDWVTTLITLRPAKDAYGGPMTTNLIAATVFPGSVDKTIRTLINESIPDHISPHFSGRICELVIQNVVGNTFIKGLAGVNGNASDGHELTGSGVYVLRAPSSNAISIDDVILGAPPGTSCRILAYGA